MDVNAYTVLLSFARSDRSMRSHQRRGCTGRENTTRLQPPTVLLRLQRRRAAGADVSLLHTAASGDPAVRVATNADPGRRPNARDGRVARRQVSNGRRPGRGVSG